MADGGLSSEYKLVHFDFHWGSRNDVGSEHTVGGRHYPMEVSNYHVYICIMTRGVGHISKQRRETINLCYIQATLMT